MLTVCVEIRNPIYEMLLVRQDAKLLIKSTKKIYGRSPMRIDSVLHPDRDATLAQPLEHIWSFENQEDEDSFYDHTVDYHYINQFLAQDQWNHLCYSTTWRSSEKHYLRDKDFPAAAILSTCRTIATEATPFLYSENAPEIDLDNPALAKSMDHLRADDLQYMCSNIFDIPKHPYLPLLRAFYVSNFAVFINTIGPANAKTIRSLSLSSSTANTVAMCLPTITALVTRHLPKLHRLGVRITDPDIYPWDCLYDKFPPGSSFWLNEGFFPLQKALESFIDTVTWLEVFDYEGQMVSDFCCFDEGGYRMLKTLEDVAKRRRIRNATRTTRQGNKVGAPQVSSEVSGANSRWLMLT